MQYVFEATKPPTLNREWLEAMMLSATSSRGLIVMAEDEVAEYLQRGE